MNQTFLYDMLKTPSVSGNEFILQKKVYDYMKPKADRIITDAQGNVISVLNENSPIKILLAGHIDEIGLFVSGYSSNGFLKVKNAGGVYLSTYLGHKVRIYTKNGMIMGAVVNTRSLSSKSELTFNDLFIDIGANSKEEAMNYVEIGDIITIDSDYCELLNGHLSGRALDNRVGAFVVIETLIRCKEKGCKIGVYSATTVGEETTKRGAYMAAATILPTMSIAIDVTYATDYPGGPTDREVSLGAGPVFCYSPLTNRKMNDLLKDCAKKYNIPFQIETEHKMTGTDADTMVFTGTGVPSCLVSIPLRYMHNPDETVHLNDLEQTIELLSSFLSSLNESFTLNPFEDMN